MRTQLSQFCDHFVAAVRPALEPLAATIAALHGDTDGETGGATTEVSGALRDLHNQVASLCDKVWGQRSYVLIFGPLKSGKSTLMNAIAGSYVSEVSSLPAYPCLVFVSHGAKQEYVLTDYDGSTETHENPKALGKRIDEAHRNLAEHVRAAEDAGEVFDPQQHFRAAIRRVDVQVPAKNLAESGAVLVDTPGLYTRMRFGYDRMTREFRNAAACAIFVVRSDTLFLEQVFAEFNQLLEFFSRIFLVVNMDAAKRDVRPDGKLVPSLEQKNPQRIIEAFESLAMPTPLKEAAQQGRVRIYPVDLLNAASNTLLEKSTADTDFGAFQTDLHEYLASTDYLLAFLSDSLRRAQHLLSECEELSTGEFVADLRADAEDVEARRQVVSDELQQLTDCRKLDWAPAFDKFAEELTADLERTSRDRGAKVARDMSAAIETWMLSSHSLRWLLGTVWDPLVEDYVVAVRTAARRCCDQSAYKTDAGLVYGEEFRHFLDSLGIDLRQLRMQAFAELDAEDDEIPEIPLDIDQIPIRRGVFDLLTFRSADKVRDRLFGPPDNPDNRVSARQKASRLGEPAKKYLNQFLMHFREDFFADTVKATHQRFAEDLQHRTIHKLMQALGSREPKLREDLEKLAAASNRLQRILSPFENLQKVSGEIVAQVHALSSQFASTDADVLLTPMPPRATDGAGGVGEKAAESEASEEPHEEFS